MNVNGDSVHTLLHAHSTNTDLSNDGDYLDFKISWIYTYIISFQIKLVKLSLKNNLNFVEVILYTFYNAENKLSNDY